MIRPQVPIFKMTSKDITIMVIHIIMEIYTSKNS